MDAYSVSKIVSREHKMRNIERRGHIWKVRGPSEELLQAHGDTGLLHPSLPLFPPGCRGFTLQPADKHQTATLSPLPFLLSGRGR